MTDHNKLMIAWNALICVASLGPDCDGVNGLCGKCGPCIAQAALFKIDDTKNPPR